MMPLQLKFEGLAELINATDPAILRKPLKDFFQKATKVVQGEARYYAPVDTGQLRNSIQTEVDSRPLALWGKVGLLNAQPGTPLWFKGRAMEYGTGSVGDKEVSHKSGHFPPGAALDRWAKRHGGSSGFAIAYAIGKRGGLIGRRYLRTGLALATGRINGFVRDLGVDIAREWVSRAAKGAGKRIK